MKPIHRNHYRDYASDAYRKLGKFGSADAYRKLIVDRLEKRREELGTRIDVQSGSPTEAEIIRAEEAAEKARARLNDLEAAERALKICAARDGKEGTQIVRAVRGVYQLEKDYLLSHKDIAKTVIAFSILAHVSTATIYRWLAFARRCFAIERGLDVED